MNLFTIYTISEQYCYNWAVTTPPAYVPFATITGECPMKFWPSIMSCLPTLASWLPWSIAITLAGLPTTWRRAWCGLQLASPPSMCPCLSSWRAMSLVTRAHSTLSERVTPWSSKWWHACGPCLTWPIICWAPSWPPTSSSLMVWITIMP